MVDLYIVLGIIAGLLWGFSVYMDKNWVMNNTDSDILITTYTIVLSPFLVAPFIFTEYVSIPGLTGMFYATIYGAVYSIGLYFYVLSLRQTEASIVSPLFRLTPVFTIIFAVLFLRQILTLQQYIGITLVIIGVFIVSLSKANFSSTFSSGENYDLIVAVVYAVISVIVFSFGNILLEFAVQHSHYYTVFYWSRWGGLLPLLLLLPLPMVRKPLVDFVLSPFENGGISLTVTKFIEVVGSLFYVIAVGLGPVSVVTTLAALESVFVVLIASIAGYFSFNGIESLSRRETIVRGISAVIVVVGVGVISM